MNYLAESKLTTKEIEEGARWYKICVTVNKEYIEKRVEPIEIFLKLGDKYGILYQTYSEALAIRNEIK